MLLSVHGKGIALTPALRALVERRVRFALDRQDHRIRSVRVRLEDLNGPRGGVDKRCMIQVRGDRGWMLLAEHTAADLRAAVAGAADRLEQAMSRALERRRDRADVQRRSVGR
jgi:putative sigma-54 modulation protein